MTEERRHTGYGKKAKRRVKLIALADRYEQEGDAETAERYRLMASEIYDMLREASVCVRCGRVLKEPGVEFGPECLKATESPTV